MSIQFCNHYLLTSVYFSLKKHIYLLGTLTISLKLSLSIFTFTSYFSLFLFCQRSAKIRKQHYWRYIPLLGDHNLTPYNHSKNRPVWRDVDYHKRLECVFLITNWFESGMAQLTIRQMVLEPRSWVQVMGVSL